MVEHLLREREVVGLNSCHAIPKALKMVPVATLLGAQHYKANTGFSFPNKYRTTNIATLTKKSPTMINVCIHWRTVWKIGSHAKYAILLKYRDYYTPGIYADGYIVFAFPLVRLSVRMFVRNSVTFVDFASKFCVKVSQVVYISATTYQKAFIFGP